MTVTNASVFTAPVNTDFQRYLLEVSKGNCPAFVGTMSAVIQRNSGSFTATWRRYDRVSAATTPLTEIAAGNVSLPFRQPQTATISNVQAVLGKYGAGFVLTEEVDFINFTNQNQGIAEVLGVQAGQTLNKLQLAEEEDNSTAILSSGAANVASINTSITYNDLRNAHNQLARNNAMKFSMMTTGSQNQGTLPIRSTYWAITHPDVVEDMRAMVNAQNNSVWVSVEQYAGQIATEPGEVGTVAGFRVVETSDSTIDAEAGGNSATNSLRTSGNTKVDVYNTVVYGRNAFGSVGLDSGHIKRSYMHGDPLPSVQTIVHERGSSGVADMLNEASSIAWKTWHAPAVLSEKSGNTTLWCRCIRSGAKVLS